MRSSFLILFISAFFVATGCTKAGTEETKPSTKDTVTIPKVKPDTIPNAVYDLSQLEKSNAFVSLPVVTNLQRQDYIELSGIASGKKNKNLLYVLEDSGNANKVYITNTKGEDLGALILDNISNRDWEDIAVSTGPDKDKNYIYVAEIGDNDFKYPGITIYRFAEPDLSAASSQTQIHITEMDKIQLSYPDGPINAESLIVDPLTNDIYIATKENYKSRLFVARYPQSVSISTKLIPLAILSFDLLTSASISGSGKEILLRSRSQIWYWTRALNESIASTLLKKPQDAPYVGNEPQGEGIGFASDESGYYTISEIKGALTNKSAFSFYERK